MKAQWGRDLVRWDGFATLAAQLFGWLAPPPGSPRLTVSTRSSGDQLLLSASAYDQSGRPVIGLRVTGELIDAAGGARPVVLRAIAPGSYGVMVGGAAAGTYQLHLVAYGSDGQLFATADGGAILPPGHEYGDHADGDRLLAALAQITGGRVNPTPAAIYDPTASALGKPRELATALLWIALALLPLEIAIRRVPFESAALATRAQGWLNRPYKALRLIARSHAASHQRKARFANGHRPAESVSRVDRNSRSG